MNNIIGFTVTGNLLYLRVS